MSFEYLITQNIEFFAFLVFLALFLVWKRDNLRIDGKYPNLYMLLFRTRLGLDKMKSWSSKYPKIFLYLSYLSIFIGVVGAVASIFFMIWQLGFIVDNGLENGGGFVLPVKTQSGLDGAVPIFYVPFWYWVIAIFTLMIVHEFAHGVIAERFNIKIKSSGIAFFGSAIFGILILIFGIDWANVLTLNFTWDMLGYLALGLVLMFIPLMPGAFVEPDQKDLKKKKPWKQIAVFGAGSTSNFIFGGFFLLLFIFVSAPLIDKTMETSNIYFTGVTNQSTLYYEYNITSGELIGVENNYDPVTMLDDLKNLSVNETILLHINTSKENLQTYKIITFPNPENETRGMVGMTGIKKVLGPKEEYSYVRHIPEHLHMTLFWLWLLNLGIGIMNLLPIWITDGGQITRALLEKYINNKKIAMLVLNILSTLTLILIIFTLYPKSLYWFIGFFA